MLHELLAICIRRTEEGEACSHVRVTQETNGFAVWYQVQAYTPQLLAWHADSPTALRATIHEEALTHARRIAHEAIQHGEQFAAARRFQQC